MIDLVAGEDEDEDGVDMDEMNADVLDAQMSLAVNGTKEKKIDKKVLNAAMDDVYGLEFNDMVTFFLVSHFSVSAHG